MQIKKMNMGGEGLNRFFGPLESRIMDILWTSKGSSIKEVQSILSQEGPISINTVTTIMNRLLDKGHLTKVMTGTGRAKAAKFSPILSKEQFISEQTKQVSLGLMQEYGSLVVNHMIDALDEVDAEIIAKLESKLNDLKSRKKR
jgi:predicted transcriptional regulator